MQTHLSNDPTHPAGPYDAFNLLLLDLCETREIDPAGTVRRFWQKYGLHDSTMMLFEMVMAAKDGGCPGQRLPLNPGDETLDAFFRDLCEALIAFSEYTRYEPRVIRFMKQKTHQPHSHAKA